MVLTLADLPCLIDKLTSAEQHRPLRAQLNEEDLVERSGNYSDHLNILTQGDLRPSLGVYKSYFAIVLSPPLTSSLIWLPAVLWEVERGVHASH